MDVGEQCLFNIVPIIINSDCNFIIILQGKLICKKDYETWLTYDKKLQQLLTGDDDRLPKDTDGLMIRTDTSGRKPLGVAKKSKSEPSPPSHKNAGRGRPGRPRKTGTKIRVPRSQRLRERMEKQAAADASDNEENVGEEDATKGDVNNSETSRDAGEKDSTPAASEQVVYVSVSEGDKEEAADEQSKSGEMQYKVIITVPETSQTNLHQSTDEGDGADKQGGNSHEQNVTIVTADR